MASFSVCQTFKSRSDCTFACVERDVELCMEELIKLEQAMVNEAAGVVRSVKRRVAKLAEVSAPLDDPLDQFVIQGFFGQIMGR